MTPFSFTRAPDNAAAIRMGAGTGAKYLGGGTNLVDLMRETIENPRFARGCDRAFRRNRGAGRWRPADRCGARATRPLPPTMLCAPRIRCCRARSSPAPAARFATWRHSAATCCSAHAARISTTMPRAAINVGRAPAAMRSTVSTGSTPILGASPSCVATHPSDMCVALAALDAVVHLEGQGGARSVKLVDLHRLPGGAPGYRNGLGAGRTDHRGFAAGAGVRRAIDVPQGAGSFQLRFRAGVGCSRARCRAGWACARCAARIGWRRA